MLKVNPAVSHQQPSLVHSYVQKHQEERRITGRIPNNDTSYCEEMNNLAGWYSENNLLLNVSKTKELVVDL